MKSIKTENGIGVGLSKKAIENIAGNIALFRADFIYIMRSSYLP